MKTKTKTFYVGINDFHILKGDSNFTFPEMSKEKTPEHEFQIQISWQEPEREIKLTESEFDEKIKNIVFEFNSKATSIHNGIIKDFVNKFDIVRVEDLKQKLFGASDA